MELTVESIVYIGGLIVTMGTAIKMMYSANAKLKEPYDKVIKRLDHHDECLSRDNRRLRDLEDGQKNVQDDLSQLLLSVNAMLAHMETGNCTGEMRQTRKDLGEYLIKRNQRK